MNKSIFVNIKMWKARPFICFSKKKLLKSVEKAGCLPRFLHSPSSLLQFGCNVCFYVYFYYKYLYYIYCLYYYYIIPYNIFIHISRLSLATILNSRHVLLYYNLYGLQQSACPIFDKWKENLQPKEKSEINYVDCCHKNLNEEKL